MRRRLKGLLCLWLAMLLLSMTAMAAVNVTLDPGAGGVGGQQTASGAWKNTESGHPLTVPANPFAPNPGYAFAGWETTGGTPINGGPGTIVYLTDNGTVSGSWDSAKYSAFGGSNPANYPHY